MYEEVGVSAGLNSQCIMEKVSKSHKADVLGVVGHLRTRARTRIELLRLSVNHVILHGGRGAQPSAARVDSDVQSAQ